MCGKEIHQQLKTFVDVNGIAYVYCCPHCAIMALTALDVDLGKVRVRLTDHRNGSSLPAEAAIVILDLTSALCCAPTILAFTTREAAESYGGGRIMTWAECYAEVAETRCGVCGMALYPPVAYRANVGKTRTYACCILCTLALTYLNGSDLDFAGSCGGCGARISFLCGPRGSNAVIHPVTARIWQGMNQLDTGPSVPAGCHSNHLFCSPACLVAHAKKHPGMHFRDLSPAEALMVAEEGGRQVQINKWT